MEKFADQKALAGWAFLNVLSGTAKDGKIGIENKQLLIKVLGSIGGQYQIAESGLTCFEIIRDYLQKAGVINLDSFDRIFEVDIEMERIIEAQKPTNGPYITNEAAVCVNLARDYGLMEKYAAHFSRYRQKFICLARAQSRYLTVAWLFTSWF